MTQIYSFLGAWGIQSLNNTNFLLLIVSLELTAYIYVYVVIINKLSV